MKLSINKHDINTPNNIKLGGRLTWGEPNLVSLWGGDKGRLHIYTKKSTDQTSVWRGYVWTPTDPSEYD